jgi:hypothetical protein
MMARFDSSKISNHSSHSTSVKLSFLAPKSIRRMPPWSSLPLPAGRFDLDRAAAVLLGPLPDLVVIGGRA